MKGRLGLWIPWALFVAACIAWTAYWFAARDGAHKALEAALARARTAGVEAHYDGVRDSGFPLHLTLTFENLRIDAPTISAVAARLPVSINLSNPQHLIVGLANGFSWRTHDGVTHELRTRTGEMSIRMTSARKLARLSLDLADAQVDHGGGERTDIGKLLLHVRPDPRNGADAQLVIEAQNWRGATPFPALDPLGPYPRFRVAAVVTQSATLASHAPLRSWTGALRIERFDIAYSGGAVIGDGQLSLDAAHRPSGVLRLQPQGRQIVELRSSDGWWTLAGLRVAAVKPLYSD